MVLLHDIYFTFDPKHWGHVLYLFWEFGGSGNFRQGYILSLKTWWITYRLIPVIFLDSVKVELKTTFRQPNKLRKVLFPPPQVYSWQCTEGKHILFENKMYTDNIKVNRINKKNKLFFDVW